VYSEEEYIQLSSLQHYLFCPRQCALAYKELSWVENEYTALGRLLHEKVHKSGTEKRGDIILVRGLWISSKKLGLSGQADLVEFHRQPNGVKLKNLSGRWHPFPVEYKRGKPKKDKSDEVQLCAQALCLEEMLDVTISSGAIYYGKNKRRHAVEFSDELRTLTEETALRIHSLFKQEKIPLPINDKRCEACSLKEICLPDVIHASKVESYLQRMIRSV